VYMVNMYFYLLNFGGICECFILSLAVRLTLSVLVFTLTVLANAIGL